MKRNQLIVAMIIAILFSTLLSGAQIIITSENVPSAGTNYIRGIDDLPLGIDPGAPGPGQTWDFTSLVTDEIIGYSYQHPLATPFPGYFPSANLAMHSSDTAYSFLYYDTDVFELQGFVAVFEGEEYIFDYTPDMIILNFPFAYGDEISQDYYFEFVSTSGGDTVKIKNLVTKSLEADAFGVAHLPAGTFDALRATVTQVSKDSTWVQVFGNWMLISATISTTNYYDWYTTDPNVDIMLVSLTYDESWSVLESAEFFKDSYVGIESLTKKSEIDIYPNPSSDMIFIETESFHGLDLQIINDIGEIVISQEITSDKEKISVREWSSGIYICRIVDANSKVIVQEKIVVP